MIKPILSIISGALECLMCAGLIFGWSSLSSVLIKEEYFACATTVSNPGNATNMSISSANTSHLGNLSNADVKCPTQQESLNFVFAVASTMLSFSTILNGFLFDRFGTFFCRMIASFMFLIASILMIVSTPTTSKLLYVAMCLYAVGGIILLITNIQLGNLFLHARSSIITLFNGALDSSSFIFLLIKLVSDSGVALSSIFIGIACLTAFQIIRTFFLMPYKFIPFPLPKRKNYNYGFFYYWKTRNHKSPKPSTQLDELTEEKAPLEEKEEDDNDNQTKDFKQCLRDVSFWLNCVQLSLLQLRCYFYFATVFFHLESIVGAGKTSFYLNVFGTCQLFGIFTAPLNGLLIDRLTSIFSKTIKSDLIVRYKAVGCSSLLTTCLGVAFSIACVIPNIYVQYVTFVLQVVFRSFLYGGNSNYIATFYPGKYFGKLYGVNMTVGGIVGLLQFPLHSLVTRTLNGDFTSINIAFVIICLLTSVHPIVLLLRARSHTSLKMYDASKQKLAISNDSVEN